MPVGTSVEVWAVCDVCGNDMSDWTESRSQAAAIQYTRQYGWQVKKDGTVIFQECIEKRRQKNQKTK